MDACRLFAAASYGLGPVLDQIRSLVLHGRGRMKLLITELRLEAMARHLAEGKDLPERKGRLFEAARRAIKDFPRPVDLKKDGSVRENAVKSLVDQFEVFCWDVHGRGWDGPEKKSNWDGRKLDELKSN